MYTIYQGYAFPISISSDVELDIPQCRLFNHATKSIIAVSLLFSSDKDGQYMYQVALHVDGTKQLPIGVYDFELRTPNGYMAKYIKSFAKVVETAFVNLL
ncbi:MAG: hypothetical protein SOT07_00705 [Paludibacteraceae bacterium]|nr:hypothetical protein [Paludibacteraceae bacterium]